MLLVSLAVAQEAVEKIKKMKIWKYNEASEKRKEKDLDLWPDCGINVALPI